MVKSPTSKRAAKMSILSRRSLKLPELKLMMTEYLVQKIKTLKLEVGEDFEVSSTEAETLVLQTRKLNDYNERQ